MADKFYSSAEVSKMLNLTHIRVNQGARAIGGVMKVGSFYCWTDEDIKRLEERIGMRGRPVKTKKT